MTSSSSAADRTCASDSGTTCRRLRSQPYYVDVTHPEANKGGVVRYLSETFAIPLGQIATIGDMPNDVLMFARTSG